MAKKEYTKGDVVNIFGKIIGKSIEFAGGSLMVLSRGLAHATRGLFWLAGRHVDMAITIRELKGRKIIDTKLIADENTNDSMITQITQKMVPIESALRYSQSAYENDTLPLDEILKIDNQAIMMAKTFRKILEKIKNPETKIKGIKIVEQYLNACDLFLKYHSGGSSKFLRKAEACIAEVVRNRNRLS